MEKTEIFPLNGMSCSSCAASAASIAQNQEGVLYARALYPAGSLVLTYDPSSLSFIKLKDSLSEVGYEIYESGRAQEAKMAEQKRLESRKKILYISGFATGLLVYVAMWVPSNQTSLLFQFLLTTALMVFLGGHIYKNAGNQLINNALAMDTLVALSTGIAYLFSSILVFFPSAASQLGLPHHPYFESVGVILFFISFGKWLEQKSTSKATQYLDKLENKKVKLARLKTDSGQENIPVEALQKGDIVTLQAGDIIPADGNILSGQTEIDESMLSGESSPVLKKENEYIYAGTVNLTGVVEMAVVETGHETILGNIISRTEQAKASQHPLQQLADSISRYFVPGMLIISMLSAVVWKIILPQDSFWIVASVTVLIIACPCALGLATPTALVAAFGNAYKKGILLKNAKSLQQAADITDIIFDKTGTLTTGKLELLEEKWKVEKDGLLPIFATIAHHSLHPVSRAIEQLENKRVLDIKNIQEWPGKGLSGIWNNQTFWIGNLSLAKKFTDETLPESESDTFGTNVYLGAEDKLFARLTFADQLKADAAQVISDLNKFQINIHLISGDTHHNTELLAQQLGIRTFKGAYTPQEKARYVDELKQQKKRIAMVGDGINDAEALAKSEISISFARASDLARNSADVVLLKPELKKLSELISIGRKTSRVIKQNLFWAFFYNLISIPIAAGVFYLSFGLVLDPMIAGIAMALSSITVVFNSLKLTI